MYPFQIHSIALSTFASLIGPFGGFFASGFKRAFKIKVRMVKVIYVLERKDQMVATALKQSCALGGGRLGALGREGRFVRSQTKCWSRIYFF